MAEAEAEASDEDVGCDQIHKKIIKLLLMCFCGQFWFFSDDLIARMCC